MSVAREEILRRIRTSLTDVPAHEEPEHVPVERTYRQVDEAPHAELVERFAEEVADYKATVRRVAAEDLPGAIAESCRQRGARGLVVPADLPQAWLPDSITPVVDNSLTNEQLEETDGVITGCALGIAQTGTIVLDSGFAQGRRVISLVPDYHLCIVFEEQVVGLVPEAITRLGEALRESRRPITFISGPSATSDIELNRVEGVHGPRDLEVLIVAARAG